MPRLGKPLRLGEGSSRIVERASEVQAVDHAGSTLRYEARASTNIGIQPQQTDHSWLPERGTFVFMLIIIHLGALCYWCYLTYLSNRKARLNAKEPKTPPPRVNCTYDWPGEVDTESRGFWSRFRLKPFLDRKDSGRPVTRSELATIGITGSGFPSRSRIARTPTLPSTPELI